MFFKRPFFNPFAIMKMDIWIAELPFLLILGFNHCLRSKYIILETLGRISSSKKSTILIGFYVCYCMRIFSIYTKKQDTFLDQ